MRAVIFNFLLLVFIPKLFTQTDSINKYICKNNPRSHYLNFTIKYPKNWTSEDGDIYGIVQKFISTDGTLFMVDVKKIKFDLNELSNEEQNKIFSEEFVNSLFKTEEAKSSGATDFKLISFEKTIINAQPACTFISYNEISSLQGEYAVLQKNYLTYWEDKLITLVGQVMVLKSEKNFNENLESTFNYYQDYFNLMASSFVIDSKWEKLHNTTY
ncbi:MAG: hypothetical protein GX660_09690 [Clostridiaceae bacterium]|nr:hypothetical protein [Clostridiaceae bacterium]